MSEGTYGIADAGDAAVVLEWPAGIDEHTNALAVALAATLEHERVPGIRDVIPTYHTVAVVFDPLITDAAAVKSLLLRRAAVLEAGSADAPRRVEIPVRYGGEAGPDLPDVARATGLPEAEVVRMHTAREYRVYMLGFVPGFAYMGAVDPRIAVPRRATPRLSVPGGSVAIAGEQTGVYPISTPGGWQLIGRTPVRMFDASRAQPFLVAPGDRVRFVDLAGAELEAPEGPAADPKAPGTGHDASEAPDIGHRRRPPGTQHQAAGTMVIVRPGMLTTVQDLGRWGYQKFGVPVSGAADPVSHRLANRLVGNPDTAATLEITLMGPEIEFSTEAWCAVSGADFPLTLDGRTVALNTVLRVGQGERLRFGARRAGARAYVAVAGGIDVPAIFNSRATHLVSRMGGLEGRALRPGDVLPIGHPRSIPAEGRRASAPLQLPRGGAVLRVLPGPQRGWFTAATWENLQRARYLITPDSDRMGYRLDGPAMEFQRHDQLLSDTTPVGAIQVPPSGQPILLMADRQTAGGYPKIGVLATADVPLAGQLAPGDWIQFRPFGVEEARAALVAQERVLDRYANRVW
jgi:KipI family sensor histidine kinase inhibitor